MRFIFLFCISFILSACSEPTPMLQPLNAQQPILAFGDSLTFGYGASPEQSYPAQLSKLISYPVINEGINGELSAGGLRRLESLLEKYNPQLLILCHGANDILQKRNLDAMADNLRSMIALAQARHIQVILVAVPEVSLFLNPVEQYLQVAKEKNILVEQDMLADLLQQPSLHSDIVHPNNLGYRQMAQTLAQLLRDHGAI